MSSDRDLFIAYGAMMTGAFLPIYFGSFSSLRTPASTSALIKKSKKGKKSKNSESEDEWDSDDEAVTDVSEKLTSSDAWLFPVFGSVVLFSMFLVFRYLNKKYVNMLLGFYFGAVGVLAVTKVLCAIAKATVVKSTWKNLPKFKLQLQQRGQGDLVKILFNPVHLVLFTVSLLAIVFYLFTKNWVVSNLLALSLSVTAIELMSLDSFRTGTVLLGGLFIYDIFWVFGTPVMVSVARNFDAPIKIVWPKNVIEVITAIVQSKPLPELQHTMLGLGDIVIPGIFVALALRFDQQRASQAKPSINFTKSFAKFDKPYFKATLTAYVLGLATTMGVMHVFRAAQPALLYLSPACSGSVILLALARGEFAEVWAWTDEDEDAKENDKKAVKDKDEVVDETVDDAETTANDVEKPKTRSKSKA